MRRRRAALEIIKTATDLLKALIWPALILFFALYYQNDFLSILRTREFKVSATGGIEIGKAVETLETAQAGIDQVFQRWSQAPPEDQPKIKAQLQRYLSQDLGQLSAQLSAAATASTPAAASAPGPTLAPAEAAAPGLSAPDRERQGFRDLASRNFTAALDNFDRAYALFPTLHNVEEIRRILRERSAALKAGDDGAWKQLYDEILKNYAWGMPPDVRDKFQAAVKPG
jgi:hypothetical protein